MWYNASVVAEDSQEQLDRLQAIMTELLKHRIAESLALVEGALARWRSGEHGEFEAHAEVLRHAARTERLAARMARVGFDSAGSLLRDAYDLGMIDEGEFRELTGSLPSEIEPTPGIEALGDLDGGDEVELPDKKQVVTHLLDEGAILLHVDARCAGVSVPEKFLTDCQLVLRFGYNLSPAIPDLEITDDGVSGTLRFGGVPHRCVLPWRAVYAVRSEANRRGLVWPDDVPDAVVKELARDAAEQPDDGPEGDEDRPSKRGGHLRLVD